jgi:ATP-binding cassette subfamily B protein
MLFLFTVLSTAVTSLYPLVFKNIVDNIVVFFENRDKIDANSISELKYNVTSILLVFALGMIISNLYPYFRGKLNLKFEILLRNIYFKKLLQKQHPFFMRFRTGDVTTRITTDLKSHPPGIPWFMCSGFFRAFNSLCIVIFCISIMFSLDYKLTLISIIPVPFVVGIFFVLENKIRAVFSETRKRVSITNDFLESAFSGIKIVKSFGAEMFQKSKFAEVLERRFDIEVEAVRIMGLFHVFFTVIIHAAQVAVLFYGGVKVIAGDITVGTYFAFYTYLGMIIFPLIDIPQFFVTGSQAFTVIDRLDEIDSIINDKTEEEYLLNIDENIKSIRFENVSFRFESLHSESREPFSLENISFDIKGGEKIAVIGRIGSGKTTLLNIISGIYNHDTGKILINDIPVENISRESYLKKIGYIQQEPLIFSESIWSNIDFWRNISEEIIIRNSKMAQLHEEIDNMEKKYQQQLGQKGIGLSGGQRQRLSIARALSGYPEIILMDDITSALDAENENRFWEELEKEHKDITCIIVTHRMSTALKADRIIVLDDGKIEAFGNHDELLMKSATYRELIEK